MEPIIEIIDRPIERDAYRIRIPSDSGAIVEFSGIVRDMEDGLPIRGIEYEVFREMALAELSRIAQEIIARYTLTDFVCVHRCGFVPIHYEAVYVRTVAPRRREAFDANMEFVEKLKQTVPIWKHPVRAETEDKQIADMAVPQKR